MAGEREAIDRVVEQVDRDREGALEVLTLLQELLRDAMVDCAGGPLPPRHPDAEPRKGLLAQRDVRHLAGLVDRVEASRDRLSRNVHPGWVVEDLLVHLSTRSAWP